MSGALRDRQCCLGTGDQARTKQRMRQVGLGLGTRADRIRV